jgi:uncharacterized protein involved in exopolysaccharide biosynthesis
LDRKERRVSPTGTRTQIADPIPSSIEEVGGNESNSDFRAQMVGHLRLLWTSRRFLGKAVLAGLIVGLIIAFLIPSQFESSVQLMPPDSNSNAGLTMLAALTSKTGNGLGAMAGDLLGVKSSGALFVGILRSQTVEDRVVERFDLRKVYKAKLQEDARRRLAENTGVSEDRKSGIILITVTDHDPKRAAGIAEAYVGELNTLVAQVSTSAAHRERVFLEERLTDVKTDLDDAAIKFSKFASKNATIDLKEQGRAMVEAAARLQGEMIAAQSQLKGLEEIYMPGNVRVRAVQARISELQTQLSKLGGKDASTSNAAALSGSQEYPSIRELPVLGVTYGDLYRRTRIEEAVFETLTQQYELAKVQEAKETPSVKVLDVARVPERKSFPPRGDIALLTAFLALGLASVVVFARSSWNEADSDDPGKILAKEVFYSVNSRMPWSEPNGSRLQGAAHKVWVRLVRRANRNGSPGGTSV